MNAEGLKLVDRFLNIGGYTIPLAQAAEIVGATLKDVTNWRQRELLTFPTHKIGNRYFVTRDGMIALGVMAELSWIVGPETASAIARAIWARIFARSPHGLDLAEFRDWAVCFRKPISSVDDTPFFPEEAEGDWRNVTGFPMNLVTAKDLQRQPIPNGATVILPIGQLVCMWAVSFESQIAGPVIAE